MQTWRSIPVAVRLRSVAQRYRRVDSQPSTHFRITLRSKSKKSTPLESANKPSRRSRLEAVLFQAREPLSLRALAKLANLTDATEARTLLAELSRLYDARGSAFTVEQVAGGYQLLTRKKFAPWLRKTVSAAREMRLTQPALETLAVVAYRQPLMRAEIEAIRGVQCGELLRQLMDRELLRIVGRSEELGRPLLYGTTRRFLEAYGLQSLGGLPLAAQLRKEQGLEKLTAME